MTVPYGPYLPTTQRNRNKSYQTKHNREDSEKQTADNYPFSCKTYYIRKAVNHGRQPNSGTFYLEPPRPMTPRPQLFFSTLRSTKRPFPYFDFPIGHKTSMSFYGVPTYERNTNMHAIVHPPWKSRRIGIQATTWVWHTIAGKFNPRLSRDKTQSSNVCNWQLVIGWADHRGNSRGGRPLAVQWHLYTPWSFMSVSLVEFCTNSL